MHLYILIRICCLQHNAPFIVMRCIPFISTSDHNTVVALIGQQCQIPVQKRSSCMISHVGSHCDPDDNRFIFLLADIMNILQCRHDIRLVISICRFRYSIISAQI